MCFKIFHFIELCYNVKITRMKTEWLEDDYKNVYLMNVYKIRH